MTPHQTLRQEAPATIRKIASAPKPQGIIQAMTTQHRKRFPTPPRFGRRMLCSQHLKDPFRLRLAAANRDWFHPGCRLTLAGYPACPNCQLWRNSRGLTKLGLSVLVSTLGIFLDSDSIWIQLALVSTKGSALPHVNGPGLRSGEIPQFKLPTEMGHDLLRKLFELSLVFEVNKALWL